MLNITDTALGTSLGVSVLSTASSASLSLTGTTVTGATLSSLEGLLPAGQTPLDGLGHLDHRLHHRQSGLSLAQSRVHPATI